MPHAFSRSLSIFMANLLPAIALIWPASFVVILKLGGGTVSDSTNLMALIALGLSAVYILFPYGVLIQKWASEEESLASTVQYSDVALTFATDYDKENPMTTQSSLLRLLDLQI